MHKKQASREISKHKEEAGNATDSHTFKITESRNVRDWKGSVYMQNHSKSSTKAFLNYFIAGILHSCCITAADGTAGSSVRNAAAVQVFILIKSTCKKVPHLVIINTSSVIKP